MAGRTGAGGVTSVVALAAVALAALAGALAVAAIAFVVWAAIRHPFCACVAGLSAAAILTSGPLYLIAGWVAVAVAVAVWRRWSPATFERLALRRWRRTFVYAWRWRRAMAACDLDRTGRGWRQVPRLGAVWSTRAVDVVSVHPLAGQDVTWFAARARELAWALGARRCAVRTDTTGVVRLELYRRAVAVEVIPPPTAATHRQHARTILVGEVTSASAAHHQPQRSAHR